MFGQDNIGADAFDSDVELGVLTSHIGYLLGDLSADHRIQLVREMEERARELMTHRPYEEAV